MNCGEDTSKERDVWPPRRRTVSYMYMQRLARNEEGKINSEWIVNQEVRQLPAGSLRRVYVCVYVILFSFFSLYISRFWCILIYGLKDKQQT